MIKYCLKSDSSMLPSHRTEVVKSLTALATSCVLALLLATTCNPQVAGSQQHGPVFVVEPRDVLFTPDIPGGKVSFSCSAKAKPPSMYRWIRNGNFVKKRGHVLKADAQLVLVNPTEHRDSGSYQCLASNIFGAILSHPANLQFAYLQEFQNEHRGTVAIRLGQGVMLMCAPPPHAGALVFEWVFGDSSRRPVQSDARRFISQSTGNLYIAQVDSSDVGSYRCIVQSKPTGRLTTSPPTPLTLKHGGRMGEYEPRIEVHFPPRWHVLRGENIKLECFALGNPVPSLSWRRLEGDLPSKAKLLSANALLEIPDFHPHDSGTYECRAENSAGHNTVRGKISIYAPPHWIQPIKDGEHAIDDVLQWRCKAGGKPQPTYTWLHNGMEISSEGRIHVGESGTLTINILKPVDRGMYQCRADNGHGSIFSSAELQLEVSSPDFGKSPLKLETPAARGGEARISCEPKAWPKPNFTWKRDGLKLDASNRFNILDDGTLEISDVVEHDEGSYTCTAQNALGKANSTGRLVIKASTQITIAPIDQMVSVGEKVFLPCEATHDPSLSITFSWTLDGHSVEQEQHGRHFHSRELKGHLIINSVQLRHAGNYTCTVRSTVDTVSASAELRVRGPPEPPTDLQIHDVTDATAVLSWVPGHDNHSPITQFLAQARASLFLDWTEQKTDPSPIVGEIDMAMVVGLTPWTDYEFRLIAINALGHSKSSPPSRRIRTLSAAPKIYPEGLGGGKGKRHELVITWKPIERRFRHGPDFGYIIAFRMNGSHTFRQVTIPLPDAPRYTYKNTSLASFTPFEVKIRAYNVEAEGPFSPSIIVFSAEQEPNVAPASIFAKSLTSSTVEVTWEPISPNAITERIQGYQVVYSQQGDPKASLRHERVPLGENRVRLTGLRSATTYHITVQAFNTAGTGPSSPTTTVITRKGPPSKSPRLAQWWLDGSTVSLYWEQVVPMANESAVTGYKVLYRAMDQTSPHELLTNGTSAELALTGATSYVIEVRAQSDMGDGPSLQLQVPNDSSRDMKFGGPLGSACRPFTWDAMLLALLSVFVCYVCLV